MTAQNKEVATSKEVWAKTRSTVWTPFSIVADKGTVREWNGGYSGADYRYFSDIFDSISPVYGAVYSSVSTPVCQERNCGASLNGQTPMPLCQGVRYTQNTTSPACDEATRVRCPAGSVCNQRVASPSDSGTCVKMCDTATNGTASHQCSGYMDTSNRVPAYCAGAYACSVGGGGAGGGR